MKDKEKPSSVVDLADRRPTPKELPAFAPPEPDPEETRTREEFWAAMAPFHDGLQQVEAELLSRLIRLVLPELKRLTLFPIRDVVRKPRGLPEKLLQEWEARLGSVPARIREAKWLDERAYPLERGDSIRGIEEARKEDSGVISGRTLYLLGDGRLGLIELSGLWKMKAPGQYDTLSTFADAELIEPLRAVKEFHLHDLVASLRYILWNDRGMSSGPPEADLELRRSRFTATVKDLSKAAIAYTDRIRRAGIGPV
ncbi:hypothetical protein [Hyalangium rubrum]|uniref:Cyclic nucleotide-binding domain-containing protein n=1 Tax=Hyalangium rubrum TaxID=3103134 RepID=A0ABU5H2P9_9BACT|nr:hypothetical protein [Hyalangium sp. s54d21]MDY7227591.1 hypothetical protein [Hyalangium sp. s54d21]